MISKKKNYIWRGIKGLYLSLSNLCNPDHSTLPAKYVPCRWWPAILHGCYTSPWEKNSGSRIRPDSPPQINETLQQQHCRLFYGALPIWNGSTAGEPQLSSVLCVCRHCRSHKQAKDSNAMNSSHKAGPNTPQLKPKCSAIRLGNLWCHMFWGNLFLWWLNYADACGTLSNANFADGQVWGSRKLPIIGNWSSLLHRKKSQAILIRSSWKVLSRHLNVPTAASKCKVLDHQRVQQRCCNWFP